MYKSLIEVERKRQASLAAAGNDGSILKNDVPRGTFIRNRNIAAFAASGFASPDGKIVF